LPALRIGEQSGPVRVDERELEDWLYSTRLMVTSVAQIDVTSGHLLSDSKDYLAACSTPTTAFVD
jgi:hypothetical protein